MIIFGTHKYGWVDEVDGLGTVATMFIHVMYVPLIPTGSYLMIDEDQGLSIPLSLKSVAVGYLRALVFWTAVLATVFSVFTYGVSCLCAVPTWLVYAGMPFILRKASEERADELRTLISQ